MKTLLQMLPAVHTLQADTRFEEVVKESSLSVDGATILVQEQIDHIRNQMLNDEWDGPSTKAEIIDTVFETLEGQSFQPTLRPMINATGVILHTNLGRARLSERAIKHMTDIARQYSNLEYDINNAIRGSRHSLVERLLKEITGAEAAMIVNNNAAAVFLTLSALASGQNVIVSRGELVEIGGSFRISSIMEQSGALLKEVGTTNKTHQRDYEQAIDHETAMLMKVHTSNFKIFGFTKSVNTNELVQIAEKHPDVFTYEDLGSGALFDLQDKGVGNEPLVKNVIATGVDLVSFSGDKLLGGPQAGIIAGKESLINKLKQHQLARVLRVDKFTLAALEATLFAYKYKNEEEIPTLRDILLPIEEIRTKAETFIKEVNPLESYTFNLVKSTSQIGGGTMPEVELSTYVVSIVHKKYTIEELHLKFRMANPSIIARIKDNQLFLDFRTITEDEQKLIVQVLGSI
ncbi:L-seryl-tRNA(Sec) selenium transferase [Pseudalkalibacillus decolorationis]|uniref:L-seryl-tRNA(Sec) selenium transferase n=1 Tax=Pseudalkalibacillus decolorationis TaxID=163879 RepID=UPI002148534B|nr:L-seryl-tRNA(Sec) selenium transferase [Pseudalkalibacillus decolorationis]